jgi:prepilin-type N-terminal cleavage/methylation domain-containing protein
MLNKNKKGFTLIELLIVIGIIAILAGIVLVAVNPAQQFGKANDSERKSEIGMMLSAIYQYQTSPTARGELPKCTSDTPLTQIPKCDTDDSGIGIGNGGFEGALELGTPGAADTYDCSGILVPSYLRAVPVDPNSTYNDAATGYYICQSAPDTATSTVYVLAPGAEVFKTDGGCDMVINSILSPVMCVSG